MVKRALDDLVEFGGPRTFATPLVLGQPNIGDRRRLFSLLNDALDRGWLSNNGPLVQQFERRVAQHAGTRYCVATCNATLALQVAIGAAGLSGEIIVPSLTFPATAHAVAWRGMRPVFCDVDPLTGSLDASRVEALIGPRTTAILGVHLWGRACAVEELEEVARRNGLALIFDASHAFGCTYRGRPVGGFGVAEVFSFHATKFVTSFEGGALVTDDEALATRARSLCNFGITGPDEVSFVGVNAKMSEAAAAMGLVSLDSLEAFRGHNARNYARYRIALAGIPGVTLLRFDETERNNYQYVVIDVDERLTGIDRDTLCTVLAAENLFTRRYFHPGCHRMAAYDSAARLPNTEALAARSLVFPTGTAISAAHIDRIGALVRFVVRHGEAITRRIRERSLAPVGSVADSH